MSGRSGRVVAVDGLIATVDFWGVRRQVRLDVVDEPVAAGDYILNHVGFAIRRIPAERDRGDAGALRGAARARRREDDLMAADVRERDRSGAAR